MERLVPRAVLIGYDLATPAERGSGSVLLVDRRAAVGGNASVTRLLIERPYAMSGLFNAKGHYVFYGKTAGTLITGNEDGIKHAAMSTR